jgi:hypothetical protein
VPAAPLAPAPTLAAPAAAARARTSPVFDARISELKLYSDTLVVARVHTSTPAPVIHSDPRPLATRCLLVPALAVLLLLLAGCGSGQTPPAKLAANQASYIGKEVTSSGTVEEQKNPRGAPYYVLADAERNLVLLEPVARVRRYRGEHVTVRCRFEFDPRQGRLIRVAVINRS